ncbi:hypothetical protein F4779DRAFT_550412 [Xylariaceae sp. FL0662B]|nr:hypothetical protein F4779DRAFT_550412 [Xylariaceae sp. FL0662B]
MATGSGFRFFPKLPTELQFIIWDLYRDGQPHQPPDRHCFSLSHAGKRVYATFNESSHKVVDILRKQDDSPLPYQQKIRFPGAVFVETHPERMNRVWHRDYRKSNKSTSPAFVFVDFERDLFYFDQCDYHPSVKSGSKFEWFRFLCNPINRESPPQLGDKHWIFKVKKLALRVNYPVKFPHDSVAEWDLEVLEHMVSLETLLLVVPGRVLVEGGWASTPHEILKTVDQTTDTKMLLPMKDLKPTIQNHVAKYSDKAKQAVMSALGDQLNHTDVQVVVDAVHP